MTFHLFGSSQMIPGREADMFAEVIENWLAGGLYSIIDGISLKPIEHCLMKGKPLSSEKGQAIVFFLIDDKGHRWILKKFKRNNVLDMQYLRKVSCLLPKHPGFLCGTERHVLTCGALGRESGYHYKKELNQWLDGTILMPRTAGFDWAGIADELRSGGLTLNEVQRFTICKNLTQLVERLEACQCAHRDFSGGNVFIDINTLGVALIDYDSLYHASLSMPKATTSGTIGYAAPYAWNNGDLDPSKTWCEYADRYALSLIIAEFLLINPSAEMTGDGGIFDQEELRKCSGKGLSTIVRELQTRHPQAAQLLEKTIQSSQFSDCPSPQDWYDVYITVPGVMVDPPSLKDFPPVQVSLPKKRKAAEPVWPAPRLDEIAPGKLLIPKSHKTVIPGLALPANPWINRSA